MNGKWVKDMSINDVLAVIAFLGLLYTIFYNSALFVKNKIIFDIFDELNRLNALNKIVLNKITYVFIYGIGGLIFLVLYKITGIIPILLRIIEISIILIAIIIIFLKYHKKKYIYEVINYKETTIMLHVYILLFIFIVLISIEDLPFTAFFSIRLFFFYINNYLYAILLSFMLVTLTDEVLLLWSIEAKYVNINNSLRKINENLWLTVVLKNGGKISGDLWVLDINFLTLIDLGNIIYNIKYKQIEVIGAKYYLSDANPLKIEIYND